MPVEVARAALAETLGALVRLQARGAPLVRARPLGQVAAGEGWTAPEDLAAPEALSALLGRTAADLTPGALRPDVAATLAAQNVAWVLALPAVAALVADRRVPELAPGRAALRIGAGALPEEAALGGGVHVLAGDPLAGADDARVVAGEDELVDALWHGLEALLAPLLAALAERTGRPERALWRMVHDVVANAAVAVGEAAGARPRAWALWARAAERAPVRLRGRARPAEVVLSSGARTPLLLRGGCCLYWRADGGSTCPGCPLTPETQRAALLAPHVEA